MIIIIVDRTKKVDDDLGTIEIDSIAAIFVSPSGNGRLVITKGLLYFLLPVLVRHDDDNG
jgi:hypothetical protein